MKTYLFEGKTMSKRDEVLTFCKINGLEAKSRHYRASLRSEAFSDVSIYCPETDYADVFGSWDELHAWLLKAVRAQQADGTPCPWEAR